MDATPMNLPDSDRAVIEDAKLTAYLLNPTHDEGGPKAHFFLAHGYRRDQPGTLRAALLAHGRVHPVVGTRLTPHGMRYTISGPLLMPDGQTRVVRTVWQVDIGTDFPRLITAHPDD
jgi:hypothetical protein